jgi:hypothetical protein
MLPDKAVFQDVPPKGAIKWQVFPAPKVNDKVWWVDEDVREDNLDNDEYQEHFFMSLGIDQTNTMHATCTHCNINLILKKGKEITRLNDHLLKMDHKNKIVLGYCPSHGGKISFSRWGYEELNKKGK